MERASSSALCMRPWKAMPSDGPISQESLPRGSTLQAANQLRRSWKRAAAHAKFGNAIEPQILLQHPFVMAEGADRPAGGERREPRIGVGEIDPAAGDLGRGDAGQLLEIGRTATH